MRSRLVIPAALLVTAAYLNTRRGAHPIAPLRAVPAAPPVDPTRRARAEAEAADATALATAEAAPALAPFPAYGAGVDLESECEEPEPEPPARAAVDEPPPVSEWTATVAPGLVAVRIAAAGRFSLGGWASQAGHMALCGITFAERADAPVDRAAIRLVVEAGTNVADGGLVVLDDPGFAPDVEGFTLLLAAAGPGGFAASGRYELVAR